tara:strand:- start:121 stop:636 length:516 start_codon:yes stop_codon:yes gene_type:complete
MSSEDLNIFPWLKDINTNLIKDHIIYNNDKKDNYEYEILRDELKIIHYTYKKEIYDLKQLLNHNKQEIKKLLDKSNKLDDENMKLCENIEIILLKNRLLNHSLEEWIGKSLKFHYLFKEMDKIGLKQSEYIFDAYKDINMPIDEIPIHIRERYIPTMLTNMVELESSDEEL